MILSKYSEYVSIGLFKALVRNSVNAIKSPSGADVLFTLPLIIIAFVNNSNGDIFSRGTDYKLNATTSTIAFTSTPNGNLTAASQTLTGWHMIAVTAGAGTTTIYNNNVSVASGASTAAATTGTSDIYLMQNNTGNLGSFFFYQRALSSTEISQVEGYLNVKWGLGL